MNVLFIHANNSTLLFDSAKDSEEQSNDYLTDSLFLEIKSRSNFNVYECPAMLHMYMDCEVDKRKLTGLGFGLRKKITSDKLVLSFEDTILKIRNKFFDLIFTDSRTMNEWWKNRGLSPFFEYADVLSTEFLKVYPKEKIIILDGEDQPNSILPKFYNRSLYFKRELVDTDINLLPIGYCFPKELFKKVNFLTEKKKNIATVIPSNKQTYIFSNEDEYYEDYRTSLFGLTWKKLGWDCFRHYEIIFSSCLPVFPDIDDCPQNTLTRFPKDICKKILKLDCLKSSNHSKRHIAHDLYCFDNITVENDKINLIHYKELLDEIIQFAFENNTSEKTLDYILNYTKI